MIKKLQRKFIFIATVVITVFIVVLLAAINVANYIDVNDVASQRLEYIVRNQGKIPRDPREDPFESNTDDRFSNGFSPEMPYETRYFTVTFTNDIVTGINLDNIAAIDAETAVNYATLLYSKGETGGYYNDYKYTAVSQNGGVMYVFLDCTRDLNSFRAFLWTSLIIGGVSIAVVFMLIFLFSNRAIKPYVESYNKQKQFITDANHELKTPLAVIKASNEVIEMENGKSEWTQTIEKQVARLSSLIEKLVFLSRMDEESIKYETSEFSLSETAEEISAPFESLAITQNKEFTVQIESDLTMNGDMSLIGQLINILLDNAFKFSQENGTISLLVNADGKRKVIAVTNTSENIDTENLDKLFDRFYRSDKSRNSETGGFGIGLSVAKSIVNLHKGKITARSSDGKRITFTVTI